MVCCCCCCLLLISLCLLFVDLSPTLLFTAIVQLQIVFQMCLLFAFFSIASSFFLRCPPPVVFVVPDDYCDETVVHPRSSLFVIFCF